jgi:hypothetical protein
LSFVGVTAADAQSPACYTAASLQGQYALIGTDGANVAIAFSMRYFDGNSDITATFLVNERERRMGCPNSEEGSSAFSRTYFGRSLCGVPMVRRTA